MNKLVPNPVIMVSQNPLGEFLFSKVGKRDVVSWNNTISGSILFGDPSRVAENVKGMRDEAVPNLETLSLVTSASANSSNLIQGEKEHGYALKYGLNDNPYVYYLYNTYGFGKREIGQVLFAGFGSSMLFGTIIGSLVDKQGQKRECVTYCITYPELHHQTFSQLQSSQIGARIRLLGNVLVDTLGFGPVPFNVAACFLTIGMAIILSTWNENYGDPLESKDLLAQFKGAAVAIASNEKVALLGAIQSLFEGSMYTSVFLWTPALSPNAEDISHGFIFATFMLASMLGSSITSQLMGPASLKVES
ncbi:hypothetical protein NE237_007467 [Protea cynaroides]|uniref:Uncharacterized protein n=1 Tax=Protea cynaroides TaxID=273540 RepID=A0A9Q0QW90_9MAGN|nr:hypothetical protein NE237_007467 [Protea cynaroides]